jgi:hypothetical protein
MGFLGGPHIPPPVTPPPPPATPTMASNSLSQALAAERSAAAAASGEGFDNTILSQGQGQATSGASATGGTKALLGK